MSNIQQQAHTTVPDPISTLHKSRLAKDESMKSQKKRRNTPRCKTEVMHMLLTDPHNYGTGWKYQSGVPLEQDGTTFITNGSVTVEIMPTMQKTLLAIKNAKSRWLRDTDPLYDITHAKRPRDPQQRLESARIRLNQASDTAEWRQVIRDTSAHSLQARISIENSRDLKHLKSQVFQGKVTAEEAQNLMDRLTPRTLPPAMTYSNGSVVSETIDLQIPPVPNHPLSPRADANRNTPLRH
jgi:hypothetical protein